MVVKLCAGRQRLAPRLSASRRCLLPSGPAQNNQFRFSCHYFHVVFIGPRREYRRIVHKYFGVKKIIKCSEARIWPIPVESYELLPLPVYLLLGHVECWRVYYWGDF